MQSKYLIEGSTLLEGEEGSFDDLVPDKKESVEDEETYDTYETYPI